MPRLNFTSRKRITRDRVTILSKSVDGNTEYQVTRLDIGDLGFPSDAPVFIEAISGSMGLERHKIGSANSVDLSRTFRAEAIAHDRITYRVKVVAGSGPAKGSMLGVADGLRSTRTDQSDAPSLLPIRPDSTLDKVVWKLDTTNDPPELLINADVGDWKAFAADPEFKAIVFPQIVRDIAFWLGTCNENEPQEGSPAKAWVEFFRKLGHDFADLPSRAEPGEDIQQWLESVGGWADDIARTIARKQRALDKVMERLEEE